MPSTLTLDETLLEPLPLLDYPDTGSGQPFRYCLNTSTIRGQKLPLETLVSIAASAGYDAIEPWIDEIEAYVEKGGDLNDLRERIRDLGLKVEGAIGFFEWIVDDPTQRDEGLKKARHAMGLVARLGGRQLAAPPWGAHDASAPIIPPEVAAERYRAVLNLGLDTGVLPQLEVWGFAKNLSTLAEAAYVLLACGEREGNLLLDSYHLYKGGSPLDGLRFLHGGAISLFHVNDYPNIPPAEIVDADRVYPGDGIAPLVSLFRRLREIGYHGALSLELFRKDLWEQDPLEVAKTGLQKLKAVVEQSE